MKPQLSTTDRWEPLRGKQYLSVSRIPMVTAGSVVDQNVFKKVQKFMMEHNYRIVPTSADGHEYLTEFGRPQPTKWDNKCFACVFLKAQELCQGVFLDRFPYTLSELLPKFCEEASKDKFLNEFIEGASIDMGVSECLMRDLTKGARERNVDLSNWALMEVEQQDAFRRALKKVVETFGKPDTEVTETLMAMLVAFYRQPVVIISSSGQEPKDFVPPKLPVGSVPRFGDSPVTILMIHWEGYEGGRSHFDLVVELRIFPNLPIEHVERCITDN